MNERIRELYEQARLQAKSIDADLDPQGWMDLYHKKFAELIVRECVMLCDKVYDQNDNVKIQAGATFCREDIKEHFGVER